MKQVLSFVFSIMWLMAFTQCNRNVQSEKNGASWSQFRGQNSSEIASPVVVNGQVYIASHNGNVMVITAQKKPEVVSRTKLKGKILATPALEGNHLYIRTTEHLYAFIND